MIKDTQGKLHDSAVFIIVNVNVNSKLVHWTEKMKAITFIQTEKGVLYITEMILEGDT
ncbi:hypothetical protein [Paraliobacillus sp. JSM ZJ581]|uniref:hypothetical protein n=1 Tax=Paraliobacillus sp. JSM ZJ581 TaxID=3342118 RepID=UPI0035A9968D